MTEEEIRRKIADLQDALAQLCEPSMVVEIKEPSEEAIREAREMNPIDDVFFSKMAESPEVLEEIVSTVLGCKVKVVRTIPQSTITNLQGRSVRLDAFADVELAVGVEVELQEDSAIGAKGAKINVEVQRSDNDDHQKRVLFNAAALMLNETPPGTKKFKDVPDVIVIFISQFDIFKKGKTYYKVNRVIDDIGDVVYNGMSEYYVNAAVKDRSTAKLSDLTDLMEIFVESDRYDYKKFPKTSERKNQFKNTEEGVRAVSERLEAMYEKREQKKTAQFLRNLMDNLKMTLEQAMDALSIPQDERKLYTGMINNS